MEYCSVQQNLKLLHCTVQSGKLYNCVNQVNCTEKDIAALKTSCTEL